MISPTFASDHPGAWESVSFEHDHVSSRVREKVTGRRSGRPPSDHEHGAVQRRFANQHVVELRDLRG